MTAVAQTRKEALAARLDRLSQPRTSGWLTAPRQTALGRLEAMGLPTRRDEYWRYTDPSSLNASSVTPASMLAADDADDFATIDGLRVVFVDGVLDAEASDALAMEGVEFQSLAATTGADIHWAQGLYGSLEAAGQTPVARPFAALNTAFAREGVLLRTTGAAPRPISLVYRRSDGAADAMVHHVVRLEPGASLTLLENGPGAARFSSVLEVDVAKGAQFHHLRIQGRDHERRMHTHVFARIGDAALFKSFTLSANGVLTRNEAVLQMLGSDAVAHVAGAVMGDGADGAFHHDDTVFIAHHSQRCESRQVFKKVLKNGAVGVFQGKILVVAEAQKTDGYQISQALLLDSDSQFLAKPELEIYADDVKCSHGSTTGAIDETALHYLRSRGVPLRQAQALLVLAFLAEAIDEVEDYALAEEVRARLEAWLEQHTG